MSATVVQFLQGAALGGVSVAGAVYVFITILRPLLEAIFRLKPGSTQENSFLQLLAGAFNFALDLVLAAAAHFPLDLVTVLAIAVFAAGQVAGQSVAHTSIKAQFMGRLAPGFGSYASSLGDSSSDSAEASDYEPKNDDKASSAAPGDAAGVAADVSAGS